MKFSVGNFHVFVYTVNNHQYRLLSDIAKEAIRSGFSPPSVTGNEEPTITYPENKIQIIF